MNRNSFIKLFIERQPPELVLKTIGIKPGMIIGEVGAGRGLRTYQRRNILADG